MYRFQSCRPGHSIRVMETKRSKLPTLRQFQQGFPTDDACLEDLMRTRYGQRPACARCEREARYYRGHT